MALAVAGCPEDDDQSQAVTEDGVRLSADGTMHLLPGEPDPTTEGTLHPLDLRSRDLARDTLCEEAPSILVSGDHGLGKSGLIAGLQSLGHQVTESPILPDDLSGFDMIYYVGFTTPLTAAERERLATFVADGGGLHLTGERPCCDNMNDSLTLLVNELVAGGGITLGRQGDVPAEGGRLYFPYVVNPEAKGGIAATPNPVNALRLLSPGGIAGITESENILATGNGGVPVAAIWDKDDLIPRAGRLSVVMDTNWLHILQEDDNLPFLVNVTAYMCGATPRDEDNDGVPFKLDCNDNDATVGSLIYENDFSVDDGFFATSSELDDPWGWDGQVTYATDGGQQAQLGLAQDWSDVVVFATVTASGTETNCGNDPGQEPCSSTDRWRAGVLLRAAADADQDEGYHGYRCSLSSNAVNGCYEDGLFLQIGEFMDAPEDDVDSECDNVECPPNTTFDQLGRQNHDSSIDLSKGDVGHITFYAVGPNMYCEARNDAGDTVSVTGTSSSFATGTVGLSTLNMFGEFDSIRVCEALALPGTVAVR